MPRSNRSKRFSLLLSLKNYNILCAFISPSCDNYVKTKQPPLIPFNIRCQMIQASIEEFNKENKNKGNDILNIKIHKWEGSQKDFIDFPYVIKETQIQLNQLIPNRQKKLLTLLVKLKRKVRLMLKVLFIVLALQELLPQNVL